MIKSILFTNSEDFGKVKNMHNAYILLFRILIGCLIPRKGSFDWIYWDHKPFIQFLMNCERLKLDAYIFNHMCDAIKVSQKHNKKNVPYAKLLSELFHQSILIDALKKVSATQDLEETYGNIPFVDVLGNMNIIKMNDMVKSEESISIRSGKTAYIKDFPFISKMDNPKVILEYIKLTKEETCILLTMGDILDALENVYKPSRKMKVVAFEA